MSTKSFFFLTLPTMLTAALVLSGCSTAPMDNGSSPQAVTVPSAPPGGGMTLAAPAPVAPRSQVSDVNAPPAPLPPVGSGGMAPAPGVPATEGTPAAPASAVPTLVLNNGAYRVKAGSDEPYTDSNGHVWQADAGFSGGDTVERDADTKVTGTDDPKMFLTEHYGMDSFTAKVPNGNYTANLYFAETFDGIAGAGQRVFSFNVMGHEYKDVDLYSKVGPDKVYELSVPVTVTDGTFHIDFVSQVENPEINAIELVPQQ